MTITQILERVGEHKPLTRGGLYPHLRALKIKPRGISRPAVYPDNAADKVLRRLGFTIKRNGHTKAKGRR